MRFLVNAGLPRRTAHLLQQKGHEAIDVCRVLAHGATDEEIAEYAQAHRLCILTRDFGFSDIRNYPPERYAGIVVLEPPPDATAPLILKLVESFLDQRDILSRLEGRLAIVAFGRIRLRPA